jgi:DNA polymerase-3 subunit gamma/tau
LQKTWNDYAMERKHEGKNSLHATLSANQPVITGQRTISHTIVNNVQENYMREEKPTLLGYLRREMDMPSLELSFVKAEAKDLRPRYTPRDKFNIMGGEEPGVVGFA